MRADLEGAESESDDGKDETASTVEELQSVSQMDSSSNLGHEGMAIGGQPGRPGLHGPMQGSHVPGVGTDMHMHRQGPHASSMHLFGQGMQKIINPTSFIATVAYCHICNLPLKLCSGT